MTTDSYMILNNIMKRLFTLWNFLLFTDRESANNFTESVFPALCLLYLHKDFFSMQQQIDVECTEESLINFRAFAVLFEQIVFILLLDE